MSILPGRRLGPYEILSAIGAGGMGEVYRARDTRLERVVAIKVLPAHLSNNPQSRERFEREAKAISSLSHPHICPLYDIGNQDGIDFLVMEYLEGETLAQRFKKGPLPTDQVLQYAIEITDALDKAHAGDDPPRSEARQHHAHQVRREVARFRVSKLKRMRATEYAFRTSYANDPLPRRGRFGTLQYMAPEQLEGKRPTRAQTSSRSARCLRDGDGKEGV